MEISAEIRALIDNFFLKQDIKSYSKCIQWTYFTEFSSDQETWASLQGCTSFSAICYDKERHSSYTHFPPPVNKWINNFDSWQDIFQENIAVWELPPPTAAVVSIAYKGTHCANMGGFLYSRNPKMIISYETASFFPTVKAIGEIISMPKILFIEKYLVFVLCAQQL